MSPRTSSIRIFVIGMALLLNHVSGTNLLEAQTTSVPFLVNNGGADTETTLGGPASVSVGFARVQAGSGRSTPSGVAIFGLRQNGVLVSEAGVQASPLISSGRIYAEVNGPITTGLAIANPSGQNAVITYYFSDQNRTSFGTDTLVIPSGSQIAGFLDLDPFNGEGPVNGTFTFTSTVPIAAVALRGLTNERGEFLMTTLPVSPLTPPAGDVSYFPHFADGAGWTTTFALVNPTDVPMTGTVQFFGHGSANTPAAPVSVTINGQTASVFNYSIAARSSQKFQTEGGGATAESGSVRVIPSLNGQTPSGLAIFSLKVDGVTVTEAGVASSESGQAFRLYAQATDSSEGSIQTGIAIANRANTRVDVIVELQTLGGGSTGLSGTLVLPGNGQFAGFLNQIDGLESLATPFEGVLRISTDSASGVSVVGLRSRINERGEFLITTTTLVDEVDSGDNEDLFFPHLVDGGGYTTQFVLLGGSTSENMVGTLSFFAQMGGALDLPLVAAASEDVTWQHDQIAWATSSTPPPCENPLVLPTPVSLTNVTSLLYPGQSRGGNYKPHGGFRFDAPGQGTGVEIFAPMDASLRSAARYLESGILQHVFEFVNECGIMYRIDHLLDLSPRFQAIADTLPQPLEGQSQGTFFAPGIRVQAGESLATTIGVPGNVFFDWGVYDLRSMNAASNDPAWLALHPGDQAPYAICWLEFLSSADTATINLLPLPTSEDGAMSDYCN